MNATTPRKADIRLALAWFAAAALLLLVTDGVARFRPPAPAVLDNFDAYYVDAHVHLSLGLAAVFALFGALYLSMTAAFPNRVRSSLGWIQLAVMLAGAVLVETPQLALSVIGLPRTGEALGAFRLWNRIATVGYILINVGLLIFLWALIDGLRRRPSGTS